MNTIEAFQQYEDAVEAEANNTKKNRETELRICTNDLIIKRNKLIDDVRVLNKVIRFLEGVEV